MKTLTKLALLFVLFLAAVLPVSGPMLDTTADSLIAGKGGIVTGGIPRPRNEEPESLYDLHNVLAGKVGGGGIPRPRNEEPESLYDLHNLLAGRVGGGIGSRPRA